MFKKIEAATLVAAGLCIAAVVAGRLLHVDELVQTGMAVLAIVVAAAFPQLKKGGS
jgi:hypothetical protein